MPCLVYAAGWMFVLSCAKGNSTADVEMSLDALEVLTVVEELRLGSADDPDYGFSRVNDVDVDDRGFLYVLDALSKDIRVYDASGTLVLRIGGSGSGPGEFEGPRFSFGVLNDSVWVVEPYGPRRITLFDGTGQVVSTGRIEPLRTIPPPSAVSNWIQPSFLGRDGMFLSELGTYSPALVAEDDVPAFEVPVVRFSRTGEVIDTVGWMPHPTSRDESHLWSLPHPDGRIDIDLITSAGDRGLFRVAMISFQGDTVATRVFSYEPLASSTGRGNQDPVSFAWISRDGAAWLRLQGVDSSAHSWMLLGLDLRPIGRVELPRTGFRLGWHRGDVLWAIELDEWGVPWLVRYRVEPA